MTNEELNTQLYKKMFAEQEEYRATLLSMPPEMILDCAYAYAVREDILLSLEYNDLSDEQAKALLKSKHPLSDVFTKWENHQSEYMEDIRDVIEVCANDRIQKAKNKENRDTR